MVWCDLSAFVHTTIHISIHFEVYTNSSDDTIRRYFAAKYIAARLVPTQRTQAKLLDVVSTRGKKHWAFLDTS